MSFLFTYLTPKRIGIGSSLPKPSATVSADGPLPRQTPPNIPEETEGRFQMPDIHTRKGHPSDVDYGAKVEPKHKAFILHTMLFFDDVSVISHVLMLKFKIYIPATAIKEYNEQAKQAARDAEWPRWDPTGAVSLISRLVEHYTIYHEISNFMPDKCDDPRFAGIRQAYDEVGFRDKKNNIWLGWSANFLIAREVGKEYHDPFVAYPELSFTEIVDPKLKAWYEC